MRFTLDKERSIRKAGEYRRVYEEGVKLSGRFLVFFYMAAEGKRTRAGITVSGKVGKACERNRAKRRIREALKLELDGGVAGADMVFVAKRRIIDASFEELRKDINKLLAGMKI